MSCQRSKRSNDAMELAGKTRRPRLAAAWVSWPAALLMCPLVARASTDGGAAIAMFTSGAFAFVLGVIASMEFSRPSAKYALLYGGFGIVSLGLLFSIQGESLFDKVIGAVLFMIVVMPIPFFAALGIGIFVRHLTNRKQPKSDV
jgi:hypothetical protein